MNLFFLAVLLTPVPLPPHSGNQVEASRSHKRSSSMISATSAKIASATHTSINRLMSILKTLPPLTTRPHPTEWSPHPATIIAPFIAFDACGFLLPLSVSTPQFWSILLIPHLVLFRQLYFDRLSPIAYGSTEHPPRTYLAV